MIKRPLRRMLLGAWAALLGWSSVGLSQHDHGEMAAKPPPPLTVSVGSATGSPGQEIDIPINVKGASGIGPMEMVLTYDPAVLAAQSDKCAKLGPLLTNCLLESGANGSGKMAILWATNDSLSGDGTLVLAHFVVLGHEGEKSALALQKVRAWGKQPPHLDALVTTEAGEFTVARAGWPPSYFAIMAAVVLLLLLLIIFGRKRNRTETAKG
jgi:hypothetical protein